MHLGRKIYVALVDAIRCTAAFIFAAGPFIVDAIVRAIQDRGAHDDRLPPSILGLVQGGPKLWTALSGRETVKVECAEKDQLEQHANSTDRAWLSIEYADGETCSVFAKVQAKSLLVRSMLGIFDVYRNELDAYANVEMPVLVPGVHIAKWSRSRFVLALSDLRAQGAEFPNIWEKHVDVALAQQVLTTLASIHGTFWTSARIPAGAWRDGSRPYKGKLVALMTLRRVKKRCPGLIPDDMYALWSKAMWHWDDLRAFYSRASAPKCMCHGDTHMGNFFIASDGAVGTFDFQVKAEEHPMRDVTYFLTSSYPKEHLARDERRLIEFYLAELRKRVPRGEAATVPTFDDSWLQYRLQGYYAMFAAVFSGGFSDLMDEHQTRCFLERLIAQMERVDAAGALDDLLAGRI